MILGAPLFPPGLILPLLLQIQGGLESGTWSAGTSTSAAESLHLQYPSPQYAAVVPVDAAGIDGGALFDVVAAVV